MNRRQKEILESQLKSEKGVLNQLRKEYRDALAQINEKIKTFQADIQSKQEALSMVTDQTQRQRLQSEIQSKIYQRDYQKALKGQVSAILDTMNSNQYDRIKDYIENCYEAGYTGTMYDLQGQGIPIIVPIDQTQVVKAVTNDTKLSVPLYTALGYQVGVLKKAVTSEISRGIATAMSWSDIARNIQKRTDVTMNQAYRIARTEGHRVQNQAAYDAQHKAKAAGADVVKQWCATLDSRTRPHHAQLDGQLRELDEPFEIDGHKALHPGGFGIAAEDINCRCRLLQRARWALDDEELNTLKERAEYFGLDKTKDFEEFQKKYLEVAENERLVKNIKYAIDSKVIDGGAFAKKFYSLTDDETERREFLHVAKTMLHHRSGQNGEDLYLYNRRTKKWYSSTSGTEAGKPEYTKEILNAIEKASDGELISFHNHPAGMPPSPSDINSALAHGYSVGYTIGHDGTIFEYTAGKEYIDKNIYAMRIAKLPKKDYNDFEAELETMHYLSKVYGFILREVK